jgi:formylglycine-generating enzyme required for sulfatase activity
LADDGWYQENSAQWSHPVGRLRTNVRGLFDIHGNLLEWRHDRDGRLGDEPLVIDPLGVDRGADRVYRGGGWDDDAADSRTASRDPGTPSSRGTSGGFHLALSPSIQTAAEPGQAKASVGTEGVAEQRP